MTILSDLALARKHVADAEQRIANQEARIAKLIATGQPTDMAEDLLRVLRKSHRLLQAHLNFLEHSERRKARLPKFGAEGRRP